MPVTKPIQRLISSYGVPIDGSAVKMIYKIRSYRLNTRVKIADRCLILALIGISLMVLDAELCAQKAFGITKVSRLAIQNKNLFLFGCFLSARTYQILVVSNEIRDGFG